MVDLRPEIEEALIRARAGDQEAFAQVFESYRPVVHRVAYRLVGASLCDDVVMETYLKAWRGLSMFRGQCSVSTWLCRIAHNCGLDAWRSRSRRDGHHVSTDDPESGSLIERTADEKSRSPEEEAVLTDLRQAVGAGLKQLSDEHRIVIELREIDGLSYKEVAAATGVSIGTVMSRLFHARRRLRRILEARVS